MDTKKICDMLNEVRGAEITAITQYMGHHYLAEGLNSIEIQELEKELAIEEMKHAEVLAERIVYLGGQPTYQPLEPASTKETGIENMLKADLALEERAIERLRRHIKAVHEQGDPTSRLMLEKILSDEEEHADKLTHVLGS